MADIKDNGPQPCPTCKRAPTLHKTPSFWKFYCERRHVEGHLMRTKKEALSAWNSAISRALEDSNAPR